MIFSKWNNKLFYNCTIVTLATSATSLTTVQNICKENNNANWDIFVDLCFIFPSCKIIIYNHLVIGSDDEVLTPIFEKRMM